ncbi:AtzE family amidohydrolase [Acetobacter estunensis]|uniref:AtzE family amidohydrolase n=1 Tax=Acetobacter estunensis TaxID=104097 RepID=UPI001C2CE361|nr:AtzE family amidohydrolase [Acetobacter estunensis]MBV1836393.1 AtzE family amidohydrolase [Acetobacter estunensis]
MMGGGLTATANRVRFGIQSAHEIVETALHELETRDHAWHCTTRLLSERALRMADTVDARIKDGDQVGPLAGVPFGVKDIFDLEGITTTAGSVVLKGNPLAKRDAAVIQSLIAAGAIPVATLNMDEFAYGFVTENAHYGTTLNPHDPTRLAGGSSGGSAAVVATGILPFALGSDTNGSIRVPAALCGVWGLRPTQGALPMDGVYPFASSLDTVGPLAARAEDLRCVFEAMNGASIADIDDVMSFRVARLRGWFARDLPPALLEGLDRIMAFFGSSHEIEMSGVERARSAAFVISASEGGNLHLPRLRKCPMDYDPATRDRLMAGALLPAAAFIQAQRLRNAFRNCLRELFKTTDILIAPTVAGVAPRIDASTILVDGKSVPARANLGILTQPLSLGGMPILAAPLAPHLNDAEPRLPVGVQLIAAPGREDVLFAAARALEQAGILGYPTLATS